MYSKCTEQQPSSSGYSSVQVLLMGWIGGKGQATRGRKSRNAEPSPNRLSTDVQNLDLFKLSLSWPAEVFWSPGLWWIQCPYSWISSLMVDLFLGHPQAPFSWFFSKSLLLSLMHALGEQDFLTSLILILPAQAVKGINQDVKNLQNLYRNSNCLLLTNTLKQAYFKC